MATPTQPTLSGRAISDTVARLSWTPSYDSAGDADFAGYTIYQDGTAIFTGLTQQFVDVVGLTEETTYAFYVKGLDDAASASPASNTVTITTPSSTLQAATDDYINERFGPTTRDDSFAGG